MTETSFETGAASLDPKEAAFFEARAREWWDPKGKFGTLHRFNPVRLDYIRAQAVMQWARDRRDPEALRGLRVLDIGCGGGLLSEPVARMGADVVAVDPVAKNVETAKAHARMSGVEVDYRVTTAEALAEADESFDIVLNMEVVEHVNDPQGFVALCAGMVRPGGLMFVATINRTLRAWGLAIVGAEYVLGWLPKGTHSYAKLVTPDEVEAGLARAGMVPVERVGVVYNPLRDAWVRSRDTGVNYMVLGQRPPSS